MDVHCGQLVLQGSLFVQTCFLTYPFSTFPDSPLSHNQREIFTVYRISSYRLLFVFSKLNGELSMYVIVPARHSIILSDCSIIEGPFRNQIKNPSA